MYGRSIVVSLVQIHVIYASRIFNPKLKLKRLNFFGSSTFFLSWGPFWPSRIRIRTTSNRQIFLEACLKFGSAQNYYKILQIVFLFEDKKFWNDISKNKIHPSVQFVILIKIFLSLHFLTISHVFLYTKNSIICLFKREEVEVLPEPAPGDSADDGKLLVVHRQGWSVRLKSMRNKHKIK